MGFSVVITFISLIARKGLKAKGFFRNLRMHTREKKKEKKNAIT